MTWTWYWPRRIIKQLGRAPQVGDWHAECCIEDLHEIESDAELQSLLELYGDEDTGGNFWETEAEARAALAQETGR